MDLTKIAENTEMTYLEKVAAIVDEFAAGNVSGEDADALAQEAGISPADLLAVHTAAYGEDIEKVASETEVEVEKEVEVEVETADEDLGKQAADEAVAELIKIAEDADATYLTKCAGLADTFAAGAISGEDADDLAVEMGLAPSDVASIFEAAYGDELEKEAGAKLDAAKKAAGETAGKIGDKIKKITGYDDLKQAADVHKRTKNVAAGHRGASDAFKKKLAVKGGAKALGTATVAGGGAAAMFGGKDEK